MPEQPDEFARDRHLHLCDRTALIGHDGDVDRFLGTQANNAVLHLPPRQRLAPAPATPCLRGGRGQKQ
jgi:hypothetical protein